MALHQLHFQQNLPATLEEAWDFFSSPRNLKTITPPEMGFDITHGGENEKIHAGMIIAYTVRPLAGIPLEWVTEITHVRDKEFFIDDQRIGPYALWNHKHTFAETANGVLMEDVIHYRLPLGLIGDWINALLVRKKIHHIFDYRREKIEIIFQAGPPGRT